MEFSYLPLELDFNPLHNPLDRPRSPGLHLQDVLNAIDYIREHKHMPDPQTLEEFQKRDLQFEKGFIVERVMENAWRERYGELGLHIIRPPEIFLDGMYLSPDYLDVENQRGIETKATAKSSDKFAQPEIHFRRWIQQVMAYAYALGVLEYDLIVFFLAGNYRPPFPQIGGNPPKVLRIRFEGHELTENWLALQRVARNLPGYGIQA